MAHIKGYGHYPLGKSTAWNFNLDGRSEYYRVKGYWKRYFSKIRRIASTKSAGRTGRRVASEH